MSERDHLGSAGDGPAVRSGQADHPVTSPVPAKGAMKSGLLIAFAGAMVILIGYGAMTFLLSLDVPLIRLLVIAVGAIAIGGIAMVLTGLSMCVKGLRNSAKAR